MPGFRSACARHFNPYSVECGEDLARSSAVTLLERGPPSFVARVAEESVSILSPPGAVCMYSACSCALFALGLDGCRHLWALVAAIDDAGLVPKARFVEGFDLVARRGPGQRSWVGARRLLERDADEIRARHRRRLGGLRARAWLAGKTS